MASSLTPLGKFTKWIVIPLALAAFGYFLLGPNLGKTQIPKLLDQSPAPSSQASGASADTSQPDVSVAVQPVKGSK